MRCGQGLFRLRTNCDWPKVGHGKIKINARKQKPRFALLRDGVFACKVENSRK